MYFGRFIEVGFIETICVKPLHPYTKMLVDSIHNMYKELTEKKDYSIKILE